MRLSLSVLFLLFCFSCSTVTHIPRYKKGKLKYVKTYGQVREFYDYDRHGRIKFKEEYRSNGNNLYHYHYYTDSVIVNEFIGWSEKNYKTKYYFTSYDTLVEEFFGEDGFLEFKRLHADLDEKCGYGFEDTSNYFRTEKEYIESNYYDGFIINHSFYNNCDETQIVYNKNTKRFNNVFIFRDNKKSVTHATTIPWLQFDLGNINSYKWFHKDSLKNSVSYEAWYSYDRKGKTLEQTKKNRGKKYITKYEYY